MVLIWKGSEECFSYQKRKIDDGDGGESEGTTLYASQTGL